MIFSFELKSNFSFRKMLDIRLRRWWVDVSRSCGGTRRRRTEGVANPIRSEAEGSLTRLSAPRDPGGETPSTAY